MDALTHKLADKKNISYFNLAKVDLLVEDATQIPSLEEAKTYINSLNLDPVLNRLIKIDKWPRHSAKKAILQYKNFLFIKKKYGEKYKLAPSVDIDEVWHAHLLHSKQYFDDCKNIFGFYLHHNPEAGFHEFETKEELVEAFENTQNFYKNEFGDFIYKVRPSFFVSSVIKHFEYFFR